MNELLALSAILAVGLGLSFVIQRPARAHAILVLAMVAALMTPLAMVIVRTAGWGVLPEPSAPDRIAAPAFAGANAGVADSEVAPVPPLTAAPTSTPKPSNIVPVGPERGSVDASNFALPGWLLLSALVLACMLNRMRREARDVARSLPFESHALHAALRQAARGLPRLPVLRTGHAGVSIWCWSRPPAILVAPSHRLEPNALRAVFAHELAHLRRRDHWWTLLGALLVVALPWHPFAWLVNRRARELAEHACDQWALAGVTEPGDYAQALLDLVSSRRHRASLAAAGPARRLDRRVRAVLRGPVQPISGRTWLQVAVGLTAFSVTTIALAQTSRPSAPAPPTSQPEQRAEHPDTIELRRNLRAMRDALQNVRLDYVWTAWQGENARPDDWERDEHLHLRVRRGVMYNGERFLASGNIEACASGFGYEVGANGVTSWDGWQTRRGGSRPTPLRDVHGEHRRTGSIDSGWHSTQGDIFDRYWMGVVLKAPSHHTLADALDHPSLIGPFTREDGTIEWQVDNPESWHLDANESLQWSLTIVARRFDEGLRVVELAHDTRTKYARSRDRFHFSEELHDDIPIPVSARREMSSHFASGDSHWFRQTIELTNIKRITSSFPFPPPFAPGTHVFDGDHQIGYVVGGKTLEFPREREGAVHTTKPLQGEPGTHLGEWLDGATLIPGSNSKAESLEPITAPDRDLLTDQKRDFGEVINMNFGSGRFHVFTVRNASDRPMTITAIERSGDAITAAYLGYDGSEEMIPGETTGVGITIQPGESEQLYTSMHIGIGLWRHAVTLTTDTGEELVYQLSANGVFKPFAGKHERWPNAFTRGAPESGSRVIPLGLRLLTLDVETHPVHMIDAPDGVTLDFDDWYTLTRFDFVAGSPIRQIAHFSIDLGDYHGAYPVTIDFETAKGVPFVYHVRDWD